MSISNNSLYSCYVKSDVNQFTYQYTVDNFRDRNHSLIKSSVFHAEDSSWTVIIAPVVKNITDGNEYLGLFLNRESGEKPVWTKYTFSLVNFQNNEKTNSKTNSCFYSQTNSNIQNNRNLVSSNPINGNNQSNNSGHQRQRSGTQWSMSDTIVVNPGNLEILRYEFSPPTNPLHMSRESVRSPVQLLNGKSSGIKSFIAKDFLLDPNNNLIQNNKITICCEIRLFIINDPMEVLDRFDTNLSPNYANLLKDGKYSDVKILVNGAEIKAHKAILSARSPVFNAMFESKMSENRENLIRIEDFTEDVMQELMSFIYSGKVTNLPEVAKELLSAADKYELPQLSQLCEQYLMSDLSVVSAPEILVLSHLHKAVKLKAVVIDFIIANRKDVMKSENWDLIRNQSDLMEELFKALSNQFDKFGVFVN